MVAERKAAGGGLGSKAAAAGGGAAKAGGGLGAIPSGADKAGGALSKFGNMAVGLLAAAAALLIISASLYVAAKAFQEFAKVKWESVWKGIAVLGGLVTAAYFLGKVDKEIIKGAVAIGILSASLYIAAKALQEFTSVKWEDMGKAALSLGGLVGAAIALGAAGPAMISGGAAVALLAGSLYIAAKGIQEFIKVNSDDMVKAGFALAGLAYTVKKLGDQSGDLIKGAASVALIAASLYIAAKGIQEFALVDIESAAKAGFALAALGGVVVGVSRLLSKEKKQIIEAGVAMALMAGSLYIVAKALQEFALVDSESLDMAAAALAGLTAAAFGISKLKKDILMGSLAMVAMGAALWVVGKAVQEFAQVKWEDMGKAGAALIALTGAVLGLGAMMASGLGAVALMLGVAAMIAMGAALYVVAQGIKALQESVGGGKLDSLGADLGKGLTAITVGLDGVDFDKLTDKFDGLQDALDELDIDDLLAFSKLAEGKLGDAATNLMNGLKNLTNLQDGKGGDAGADADFTKFTESLKTRLAPLEDVNSILEDVIEELDLEALANLSKIAGEGISGAIDGLMKGIASMAKGFEIMDQDGKKVDLDGAFSAFGVGDSIVTRLSDMEDVFDMFEDVIGELDFEGLKKFNEFGSSTSFNLVAAAQQIIAGINALAAVNTPVSNISQEVYNAFNKMGRLMRSLDVSAFADFASLANANMGLAMAQLKAGISILVDPTNGIQPLLGSVTTDVVNGFKHLDSTIGALKIEQFKAFADLSQADFKTAMVKIKEAVTELDNFAIQLKTEIANGIVHDFGVVKDLFIEIDTTFKDVKFDQLLKLSELGKNEFSTVGTNLSTGFTNIKTSFANLKPEEFNTAYTNLNTIFTKLGEVFNPEGAGGKALDTIIKFAGANFSGFKDVIKGFKGGIEELSSLTTIKDLDAVGAVFKSVNSIFSTTDQEGKVSSLDIEGLVKFGTANFSEFKKSIIGLREGLIELQSLTTLYTVTVDDVNTKENETKVNDFEGLKQLITNLSAAFKSEDINKLIEFAGKNFSGIPDSISSLQTALESAANLPTGQSKKFETLQADLSALTLATSQIDLTTLTSIANSSKTFLTLQTSLKNLVNALGTLANLKSSAAAQLKELTDIDSSKLITLSEAVIKLSDSFVILAEAIKEMGDITPVVKISDQMLKLHESVSKNPMNAEKLAEGVGAIFSGLMGSLVSFVEGGGQGVSNSFFKGSGGKPDVDDAIFGPGEITSLVNREGKLISVNKRDNIVLSTNQIQKIDDTSLNTKSTASPSSTGNYDALFAKMEQFISAMEANKDKPIVIENNTTLSVDGDKLAEVTERNFRNKKVRS
jgi:hypothetical protein